MRLNAQSTCQPLLGQCSLYSSLGCFSHGGESGTYPELISASHESGIKFPENFFAAERV